jgi:hypothetical protein
VVIKIGDLIPPRGTGIDTSLFEAYPPEEMIAF